MPAEPHTRALLNQMAQNPPPPLSVEALPELRTALRDAMLALDRPPVEGVTDEEITVDGPNGPIPVTLSRPEGPGPFPIAIYFHGGGFSRGERAGYAASCRYYAREAEAIVLNVEYRLAPEHRFPKGFEDSYAVVRWAAANGARLGGDPNRLAVFGDSAGGNFAAGIALKARDEGIVLAGQALLYPAVDMRAEAHENIPLPQALGHGGIFSRPGANGLVRRALSSVSGRRHQPDGLADPCAFPCGPGADARDHRRARSLVR